MFQVASFTLRLGCWYGRAVMIDASIIAHAYAVAVKRLLSFLACFGKYIFAPNPKEYNREQVLELC
jgi:hypothetical protein